MEEEWEAYRMTLRNLYLENDEPLEAIMAHMKEHHNFDKSKSQYERHFRDWKFRKNHSKADWKFVPDRIAKREAEGLESEVLFNGILIPSKRIKKELSRKFPPKFFPQRASSVRPPTPEGISIRTPSPTELICVRTDNLHWHQFQKYIKSQEVYFQSFFVNDRYSKDLVGPRTRASSPNLSLDFESLLSDLPEQTSTTRLIADIPLKTLYSLLQRLVKATVQTESLQIGTNILPHLQATLLETQCGELMANLQTSVKPGNASALSHFLNLAVYLLSNNLLHEKQIEQFVKWFIDNDHRVLLGSIVSVEIPTVHAVVRAMFPSILRIGDAYLIQLMIDADPTFNLCSQIFKEWRPPWNPELCSAVYERGYTPLEEVIKRGNFELTQIVLANDVHEKMADCDSRVRALYRALRRKDVLLVQLLLDHGANVEKLVSNWREGADSALPLAIRIGNLKIIELFLQAGANINAPASQKIGSALQEAIKKNDMAMIRSLLHLGAEVNAQASPHGRTAIQEAVRRRNTSVVQLLLAAGANVKNLAFQRDGNRAFMLSSVLKFPKLVQLLRGAGAEEFMSTTESPCQASSAKAISTNAIEDAMQHLGLSLDSYMRPEKELILWSSAVIRGDVGVVRALLTSGIDVNASIYTASSGVNALSIAVGNAVYLQFAQHKQPKDTILANSHQLIEVLLQAGAYVNELTKHQMPEHNFSYSTDSRNERLVNIMRIKMTALQIAASVTEQGHGIDFIHSLLRAGADINAPAAVKNGRTALQAAVTGGNIPLVELLLSKGALVNACAAQHGGRTALQAAAEVHDLEMVQLLLNRGADVNLPKSYTGGLTALQAAVSVSRTRDDVELVQLLLNAGADIHGPPEYNWPGGWFKGIYYASDDGRRYTPIQAAAGGSNKKLIEFLLESGANVNSPAQYKGGSTPLQAAASAHYGNIEIIKMLLKAGADVNAPAAEDFGVTALQGAAIRGHIGIAIILLNAGADVNAQAAHSGGRTALEGAAERGRLDMVQLLLNSGAGKNGSANGDIGYAIRIAEFKHHYTVAEVSRARNK